MSEFSRLPQVRGLSEQKAVDLRPFGRRDQRIGLYHRQRFLLRKYLGSRNAAEAAEGERRPPGWGSLSAVRIV
jgi:hypothetical protein